MSKLSKKEKRELLAAAMKTISNASNLSLEARMRGLRVLQAGYEKNK